MAYAWPFATTKGSLIAVGVVYGFCYGAYVTLLAAPVMMMGDMHDSGRRTGTFWTCMALGAVVGPPISGAIAQATDGFKAVGYYAGNISRSHVHPRHLAETTLCFPPRIVYPWSCCVPIPHKISDDGQLTWEMLMTSLRIDGRFKTPAYDNVDSFGPHIFRNPIPRRIVITLVTLVQSKYLPSRSPITVDHRTSSTCPLFVLAVVSEISRIIILRFHWIYFELLASVPRPLKMGESLPTLPLQGRTATKLSGEGSQFLVAVSMSGCRPRYSNQVVLFCVLKRQRAWGTEER